MKRPWRTHRPNGSPQKKPKMPRLPVQMENCAWDHEMVIETTIRKNDVTMVMGVPRQAKRCFISLLLHYMYRESGMAVAVVHSSEFGVKRNFTILQRDPSLHDIAGFKTPFESDMEESAVIRLFTSDSFLHEIGRESMLSDYCAVLVDDLHLRTWQIELIVQHLRLVLRCRHSKSKTLKVIFTSYHFQSSLLKTYFSRFRTDVIELRHEPLTFALKHLSWPPDHDVVGVVVAETLNLLLEVKEKEGDIVCILPNETVCHLACARCQLQLPASFSDVAVLVASEESELQEEPVLKRPGRKIVFSTDAVLHSRMSRVIAVVDSGLAEIRESMQPSQSAIAVVRHRRVSQTEAVARQHRVSTGVATWVSRVGTLDDLPAEVEARVLVQDLAGLLLWWHWNCVVARPVLLCGMSPDKASLGPCKAALQLIGALKTDNWSTVDPNNLTPVGWQMAGLPLDWRRARSLVAAAELGCLAEVLTVVAMLSAGQIFLPSKRHPAHLVGIRQQFRTPLGDAIALLRVYREYRQQAVAHTERRWCLQHGVSRAAMARAISVRKRLREAVLEQELPLGSCGERLDAVNLALLHGHVTHLVRHTKRLANGHVRYEYEHVLSSEVALLTPQSALYSTTAAPQLLFHLDLEQRPGGVALIRRACPTDLATVHRCFPSLPPLYLLGAPE